MKKKLPGVFANRDLSHVKNNETVYYSNKEEKSSSKKTKNERPSLIGQNVHQKINSIFNAPNYIYKADVEITLEDKVLTKRIIGKKNDNLITMDNELIPIDKIIDINYKK